MNPMRGLLLAGSHSEWLRRQAGRRAFVRKAVSRFMPGETLDEALEAAHGLSRDGLGVILTHLGENVTERPEADAVVRHYREMIGRLESAGLDAEVSIKLTQLGFDLSPALALDNARTLADWASKLPGRFWIDMEGSAYTEGTLEAYRKLRAERPRVGLALQSYLRRTPADVESLIPAGAAIRLVKGAYQEPASIAFPSKAEVDACFMTLAKRLLSPEARASGAWLTVGTHDPRLIAAVEAYADEAKIPREQYEFALLYGIGRPEQIRLARAGQRVRVLISYGTHWFPWYMRRLAERPANVGFVLRNMFAR
jgi:proline dehydrogenase